MVGGIRAISDLGPSFASHAHVGLGFAVSRRIWIRLDGYIGVMLPYPTVIFVDEIVARMGLPFGSGALGIEIWL